MLDLTAYLMEFSVGWLPAEPDSPKTWRGMTHAQRTGHEPVRNKHGQCTVCLPLVTLVRSSEKRQAGIQWSNRQERVAQAHLKRTGHERVPDGSQCVICVREREAAWRTRNRHRLSSRSRDSTALREARKRAAPGSYTVQDVATQMRAQRGRCYWCDELTRKNYHVDHVIPLARGGSNGRENIVIACPGCNSSKHDQMPEVFAGRLL